MSDKITLQKIFDLAWQAFIIEGKPPSYGIGKDNQLQCLYLDANGNKCAIGLALPNDPRLQSFYENFPALVKFTVENDIDIFDQSIIDTIGKSDYRLREFQIRLHDLMVTGCGFNAGRWRKTPQERMEEYIRVARDFNLTIPPARPTQPTDH